MTNISDKFEKCNIVVRAGPKGESDDNIFRYVASPVPAWAKTVDNPFYRKLTTNALQAATEIVKEVGKSITLNYLVVVNN